MPSKGMQTRLRINSNANIVSGVSNKMKRSNIVLRLPNKTRVNFTQSMFVDMRDFVGINSFYSSTSLPATETHPWTTNLTPDHFSGARSIRQSWFFDPDHKPLLSDSSTCLSGIDRQRFPSPPFYTPNETASWSPANANAQLWPDTYCIFLAHT